MAVLTGIGKRKQIQIISVAPVKDGNGFMKANEIVLYSGWAEVTDPSSGRNYNQGKDSIEFSKQFKIRTRQNLTHDVNTRIVYAGKRYTVSSIIREKEKMFYTIIRAIAEDKGNV